MNPDMSIWTGRDDTPTEGPNALRWWQCVKPYSPDAEPGIVLIGFACDEGVRRNGGRVGAKDGPRALRGALANMAWHRDFPVYDAGDIKCEEQDLEGAQENLAGRVHEAVLQKNLPLVLGGGHETAWGTFQGLTRAFPGRTTGVVNVDAHLDLRTSATANSGTPFRQIAEWCKSHNQRFQYLCMGVDRLSNTAALIDRAEELETNIVWDWEMDPWNLNRALKSLNSITSEVDLVHLSVDLDVLASSVMPAVSAPAAYGISLFAVYSVIRYLASGTKLAAIDLVEFNPSFDSNGSAAKTAAWLLDGVDRPGLTLGQPND